MMINTNNNNRRRPTSRFLKFGFVLMAALTLTNSSDFADAEKGTRQTLLKRAEVLGVKSSSDGEVTSLRIVGSIAPTFTVYKLDNPSRVVVDIVGSSISSKLKMDNQKVLWDIHSWSVGQVSAHNIKKNRSNIVRVIVGLSRPSHYQVKASGNDVLIEVRAKSIPTKGADKGLEALARSSAERQAAQDAAERELASVRAESERIQKNIQVRNKQSKSRIAEARRMMDEANRRSEKAKKDSLIAKRDIQNAQKRESSAQKRESSAQKRESSAQKRESSARERELHAHTAEAKARDKQLALVQAKKSAKRVIENAQNFNSKNQSDNDRRKSEAQTALLRIETQRAKAEQAMKVAEVRRKSAEMARRSAEKARHSAEKARRSAEKARRSAEKASRLAEVRRLRASKSLLTARADREAAVQERERALSLSKNAQTERQRAQLAAQTAGSRANKLKKLVRQEQKRFSTAQRLRKQEEAAVLGIRNARSKAKFQHLKMLAAQEILETETMQLRKAQEQRQEAKRVAALAKIAAKNTKLSTVHRKRLKKEALRLASMQRDSEKLLKLQTEKLLKQRTEVATLDKERTSATKGIQALEVKANIAKSKRKKEETRLHHLMTKRSEMKMELDKAHELRFAAQKELNKARRVRMAAEETMARTTARESEVKQELALAKRARLVAEKNQRRTATPALAPGSRLRDLDVIAKNDLTRIVIAMSAPVKPKIVFHKNKEAILIIPSASISAKHERTLDTSSLHGIVNAVSSYRDPKNPKNIKIVVDLKGRSKGELKRVGNTYYWEFRNKKKVESLAKVANTKRNKRSLAYRTQSVAGFASASSPITQQTVAQISRRKRKTYRGKKVDLNSKKSDIHDLMRLLAEVGGVNIIVPDNINARVTIRLVSVPWDQALDVILASKGLGFKIEGPGLYRIATQKELDSEYEAKLSRAKAKSDSEAPVPEIFNLNYVQADDAKKQLESLLSRKGSLEVDKRTNALIINDVSANRARVIDMLSRLDTPTPQIQIEARVVEARSTFVRQFGIQWGGNVSASQGGGNATGLLFPSTVALGGAAGDSPSSGVAASPSDFAVNLPAAIGQGSGGGIGLSLGSVGGNLGLNLRLSALEDEGSVRIVSSPKITTSNNTQASIKSGVSIPISVVSANGVETTFVPAELQLQVTPAVSLRDCAVSMKIDIKKNEADFVNTGARGDPTLITKEANTTVLVQDGDTSVIGGIYTRNSGKSYSKVPFFGDLPVIGWLFKTTQENDERTEVLIFITPKITNRAALPCAD